MSARFANPPAIAQSVELRQYSLHEGARETLIDLFDREFIETQEACGMSVIGQFRDLDRADHFVWLRGFADQASRAPSLAAFYDGPVWEEHRDAANATMISSDDVLMLKPLAPGMGFDLSGLARPRPGTAKASRIEATVLAVAEGRLAGITDAFDRHYRPALAAAGIELLGAFVTDASANEFPRLPVREDESVLAWFTRVPEWGERNLVAGMPRDAVLDAILTPDAQRLRLEPTARSLLR